MLLPSPSMIAKACWRGLVIGHLLLMPAYQHRRLLLRLCCARCWYRVMLGCTVHCIPLDAGRQTLYDMGKGDYKPLQYWWQPA